MTPLPLLHPAAQCQDCGQCCSEIGTPPGFAAFFPAAGHEMPEERKRWPDYEYLMAAPREVRDELAAYYAAVDRGEVEDRSGYAVECLWFDTVNRTCKHYNYRPRVCREFRAGSNACRRWRSGVGRCDRPPPIDEEDGD
jgi:Fe-S-cluster containining protein